jgi:hypothetical protein
MWVENARVWIDQKRSNKGENACETSCRVRSVLRSFNELRYVAVMNRKWPIAEGHALLISIL